MEALRCYAKISKNNLLNNIKCIKAATDGKCKIIPVIKADAYGHGAIEFAKVLQNDTHIFAVAELGEALALREAGIENDILVLGYTDPVSADIMAEKGIVQAVTDMEYLRALRQNKKSASPLKIHIKLNTGMNRYGFDAKTETTLFEIAGIANIPEFKLCGIFSHFAESDALSSEYTEYQFGLFTRALNLLKELRVDFGIAHIANSAAILCHPDKHLDGVRPGIILYGSYPSEEVERSFIERFPNLALKPVMTLCARVGQIKKLQRGESIGYSRTYVCERDTVVATVSAGYADGVPRLASKGARVEINGQLFPVVGRICMDIMTVDVTDAKVPVKMGDEVVLWGSDKLRVEEWSDLSSTISYEIFTGVAPRVKRIYE